MVEQQFSILFFNKYLLSRCRFPSYPISPQSHRLKGQYLDECGGKTPFFFGGGGGFVCVCVCVCVLNIFFHFIYIALTEM